MNLYLTLKTLHSFWAYLVLFALASMFIRIFTGLAQKRSVNTQDRRISLISLISIHVQLLLGLALFFVSPVVQTGLSSMPTTMKNSFLRFTTVEHPLIMLVGVILFTIANKKLKKAESFQIKLILLYVFALAFLLIRIPYKTWFGI